MSAPAVGVVGASARAAVMSLARAGRSAWAVDLFCDRDLKRIAPCVRCPFEQFPHGIPVIAKQFPPGPVMYTGGLENHPDVITDLAKDREILGAGPSELKRLRERPDSAGALVPATGRWLVKSFRSSGGLGVRRAVPGETVPDGHYLEEFLDGPVMSAVFHDGELLGITEQIVGASWLHAREFLYAGNLVGWALPTRSSGACGELQLTQAFPLTSGAVGGQCPPYEIPTPAVRLAGYSGIDFILKNSTPIVLEINPRYPASVEVIEFARHFGCAVGKAIYFAPRSFAFSRSGPWDADLEGTFEPWRLPTYADIPEPGELMEAGSPVLTFFAAASTADECRERLQSRARELDALFGAIS